MSDTVTRNSVTRLPNPRSQHDCEDYAVEVGTQPDQHGNIDIWEECQACHRQISPTVHTSIL